MTLHCKRFVISGLVQGVFYRASTRRKAQELAITGWVRNLADGRVEVLACAEAPRLSRLHDWLLQGPPGARVDHVSCEDLAYSEHSHFVVSRE
jgi:acylphosphatase